MSLEKKLDGKMISDLDQATAAIETMAAVVTAYYKGLIDAGMPPETAALLVKDFAITAIMGMIGRGGADSTENEK
jgi:hypothetical protein